MTMCLVGLARSMALVAALTASAAFAAPSEKATAEIDYLRNQLSASGCKFERNGKWYDAVDAGKHIDRKYRYLLDRDQVASAEQFIERAASRSSATGKAYRVRCGNGPALDGARWFTQELLRHRAS